MTTRLPLCGWELHAIDPSNDLEKPMTERKTQRNTTELPVSVAIQKLKELDNDKRLALAGFHTSYADKARKILLRVPEVVREHVAEQSGADFFSEVPSAYSNIIPNDPQPPAGADVEPTWENVPEELPAGARPMPQEQAQRVARLTGPGRK